eukprot:3941252-Rhodomonas_salina.1
MYATTPHSYCVLLLYAATVCCICCYTMLLCRMGSRAYGAPVWCYGVCSTARMYTVAAHSQRGTARAYGPTPTGGTAATI